MIIRPRDYQIAAVQSVPSYFERNSGNPLIAMPTGTGKSVVIAMLLQYIMQWPGQRVMIATHVKELIEQNHAKLMAAWPQAPAGIYSAGLGQRDNRASIIFCGVQSVAPRAHEFGFVHLLIIDEAHLVSPDDETNYQKLIAILKRINPMLKVIGLTATPWRLGYGKLVQKEQRDANGIVTQPASLFTDICFDLTSMQSFNWLLDQGYLTTLVPQRTQLAIDVDDVKIQGGEFQQKALQLAVDRDEITRAAIEESLAHASDKRHWLTFCAGVEHAIHTAEMMNSMGIPTVAIHSKMSAGDRDKAIKLWKSGHYRAATNNNVLTTGIDFPGIDFIMMLRPTQSSVLWVQMLGRGTRPVYADGFNLDTQEGRIQAIQAGPKSEGCLVLDFAGNTARLGPINDPVIPRKKGEGKGEAPVKVCGVCNAYNHASARTCFKCGAEFTFAVKIKPLADTKELIKSDMPITEELDVKNIVYESFDKPDRPSALKVTYFCGYKRFIEFVGVEATGSSRGMAKRWWKQRAPEGLELPDNIIDTLPLLDRLKPATHIRVWSNKKPYPQILDYCFDGTCFGKEPANQTFVNTRTVDPSRFQPAQTPDWDDDIPF